MVDKNALKHQIDLSIRWLKKSFEITGYKGSSHSYSFWLNAEDGWARAYPETTGYILETLMEYERVFGKQGLQSLVVEQAKWLLNIALPSGAYTSGRYDSKLTAKPSIFNTGQILFALMTGYENTQHPAFLEQLDKSTAWLMQQQNVNGSWTKWAWKEDFSPSYYTRVIWPIYQASAVLNKKEAVYKMLEKSLSYYSSLQNPNGSFNNWGFQARKPAFTHTIAYTLRGLLEIYKITRKTSILGQVIKTAKKLSMLYKKNEGLAGMYNEDWKGDYSFICVTGHLQLSIIYWLLYNKTGEKEYKKMAVMLFMDVFPEISRKRHRGGIPGSIPFYGKYNPFRYPNWAAKFFIDAALLCYRDY